MIRQTRTLFTRFSSVWIWLGVLGLALGQGVFWMLHTPPWAAPDEPGHFLYVQRMAELQRVPHREDVRPEHWQAILTSMEAHHWQGYVHPQGATTPLAQDPLLVASGWQIDQKPPGYYLLAALWLRLHPHWRYLDPAQQLHWLRGFSLLLRGLMVAFSLAWARRMWPQAPARSLAVGLVIALLPMPGFIGTSVNNDALTMLWGTVGFAWLWQARSGRAWARTILWLILGVGLVDVGLLFLWPLAVQRILARKGVPARRVLLVMMVFMLMWLLPNPHWAAGWRRASWGPSRAARPWLASSPAGRLWLDASQGPAHLHQTLSGLLILQRQGQPVFLRVHGRGSGPVLVRLTEEGGQVVRKCMPQSQPCEFSYILSHEARHLSVHLILPAGRARAWVQLTDAQNFSLLLNGRGTYPAAWSDPLSVWLEKHLPLPAGYFSRLFYGQVWDVPSLIRYGVYGALTWMGFWGWFGWLTRPMPWWVYGGLALMNGMILLGLWRSRFFRDPLLRFAATAVGWMALMVFAPMLGQAWQPQGRYFFPALLPITLLLVQGGTAGIAPWTKRWTQGLR